MIKILWLCNKEFSNNKIKSTASWLQPMAEGIVQSGKAEIINVTTSKTRNLCNEVGGIKQYVVKSSASGSIAPKSLRETIYDIINIEHPDLIHVWGCESFWLSIVTDMKLECPYILDIQGLLFSYADFYYGNFKTLDIIKSIRLKEVLMPWRTLWGKQREFLRRGKIEVSLLKKVKFISFQSEWVKNQLMFVNPSAIYLPTKIMLRSSFVNSIQWIKPQNNEAPIIFTTASGAIPYKGIDVAIKAVAELKKKYHNVQLHIAGQMYIGNHLKDGISIYMSNLIKELNLEENVRFLGSLDEIQIVQELQNAHATIIPSFVETYCLAFAESLIVGVPTICAYSGAMPELARDKEEALFYNPLDFRQAASLLIKVIEDGDLANRLSNNARIHRLKENNIADVVSTQLGIYKKVLGSI